MAPIDPAIELNDDALRCPRCAKRISATATTCPACGYEILPHRARITCKRCGSRIPADCAKCPRCGNDPRSEKILTLALRLVAGVIGIILLACIGWIIFRAVTTNAFGIAPVEPTATRQLVQVIYVVATPIPPTFTPAPSATPTKNVSPTPTKRGAKPVATVPPQPTAIPPGLYPAIALNAPANATVFAGAGAAIVLEWQTVSPNGLKENEWYEIQLNFAGRDGKPAERKSYTKEVRWILSPELYAEIAANARTIKWTVNVVRVDGFDPLASLTRTPITVNSTSRTFIWNP